MDIFVLISETGAYSDLNVIPCGVYSTLEAAQAAGWAKRLEYARDMPTAELAHFPMGRSTTVATEPTHWNSEAGGFGRFKDSEEWNLEPSVTNDRWRIVRLALDEPAIY